MYSTEQASRFFWSTDEFHFFFLLTDPHLKVRGKTQEIVAACRQRIMQEGNLDSRLNRVTLKLDVSHTDHSHVIGRGGKVGKVGLFYVFFEVSILSKLIFQNFFLFEIVSVT